MKGEYYRWVLCLISFHKALSMGKKPCYLITRYFKPQMFHNCHEAKLKLYSISTKMIQMKLSELNHLILKQFALLNFHVQILVNGKSEYPLNLSEWVNGKMYIEIKCVDTPTDKKKS